MSSTPREHDHEAPEPITDHVHDNSWSANLEKPEHADDRDLLVAQAIQAVEHTAAGHHVNLVTHGAHGHPSEYLYGALADAFGETGDGDGDAAESADGAAIDWEYVEQCGCGGHVTRVHVG